jgi:uncharacterized protein (DUF58 family)
LFSSGLVEHSDAGSRNPEPRASEAHNMADRRAGSAPPKHTVQHRYHMHWPGVLYLGVTLFLAIGAINSQNNLLFAALGIAVGALLVSGVMSGGGLWRLRMERLPLPVARAGEPCSIRYRLVSVGRVWPSFGLHIEELDAPPGASPARLGCFVSQVRAGGEAIGETAFTPPRRGLIALARVRAWSTFPFGLTKKSVAIEQPQRLVVLPGRVALKPGVLQRVMIASEESARGPSDPGGHEEFFGLREYTPRDGPRDIAWRASARRSTLVARMWATPRRRSLTIALRRAPGESRLDTERSILLAAALAEVAARSGVTVELESGRSRLASRRGQTSAILHALAELDVHQVPSDTSSQVVAASRVVIAAGAIRGSSGVSLESAAMDTEALERLLSSLREGAA